MLKFISLDSDENKCLFSSLPEIKDIDEFFNKKTADEIHEFIINKLDDSNKKEKETEKTRTNFLNKILPMMFYQHSTKNNFSFLDSTKEIIEKILQVSILANSNESNLCHVKNFVKLYFIISSNIRGRYFLISKFLNFLNKQSDNQNFLSDIEFKFDLIENMLSDFLMNEKDYERKEMVMIYEDLSLFIFRNKLFECLNK